MPDRDAFVDAGDQLRKLGVAMSRCKLDRMNVYLLLSIDTLPLESERCWRLALAVYELMTNAVRLRVCVQAIWHQARSGLSWKLIEADGPRVLPRSCTGAPAFWPNAICL
jgi:hypothetical protein